MLVAAGKRSREAPVHDGRIMFAGIGFVCGGASPYSMAEAVRLSAAPGSGEFFDRGFTHV